MKTQASFSTETDKITICNVEVSSIEDVSLYA